MIPLTFVNIMYLYNHKLMKLNFSIDHMDGTNINDAMS